MSNHTPDSSLRRFADAIMSAAPASVSENRTAHLMKQQHADRIQIGDIVFTPMGYTSLEDLEAS